MSIAAKCTCGKQITYCGNDCPKALNEIPPVTNKDNTPADYPGKYYQPLFDLLQNEHGIIATETEMADIIHMVNKCQSGQLPAEVQLPEYILQAIELKAEHEAALQFHPVYSPDQNTACRICYRNGAKEYVTKLIECDKANSALEEKIRGLEEQIKEMQKPQGAVWVKASERLPEKGQIVLVEYKSWDYERKCYVGPGDWWKRNVERWLDESPALTNAPDLNEQAKGWLKESFETAKALTQETTDWKARYDTLKAQLDRLADKSTDLANVAEWGVNELADRYTAMKERADKMEGNLKIIMSWQFATDGSKFKGDYKEVVKDILGLAREALAWEGEKNIELTKSDKKEEE